MPNIEKIFAREILDGNGVPTISTTVFLDNGNYAFASVPSGTKVGKNEAYDLRDRDSNRYSGMGVLKAVNNVNSEINSLLKGSKINDPISLDKKMIELDGTENKENLGANVILSVSIAINKLCTTLENKKLYNFINEYYNFSDKVNLPTPIITILDNKKKSLLDSQEFWIVPEDFNNFKEKLRVGTEISNNVELKFTNYEEIWFSILDTTKQFGYENKIKLGIDLNASNMFNVHKMKYLINLDKLELSSTQLINYYLNWIKKYSIIYFEDPFDENDFESWFHFKQTLSKINNNVKLIGDNLFSTNIERLKIGIEKDCANAITIKPSQIGTIYETINCIKMAQKNSYDIIISRRSGETCDDFISDLAVGVGAKFIKAGSISSGENICKYNRLLEIEDELI